jgi:enamine deaminase RidA (YjgF/YER057c/UK114 family)
MSQTISARLEAMGVSLPDPPKPVAAYVGFVRHGDFVFVSGQLPIVNGMVTKTGLLGRGVTIEQGAAAAEICATNLLAQMNVACDGDLERIVRCIRLGGFVASTPEFVDHAKVVNGASNFIGEALGEVGAHARTSVGVAALPLNSCVEVDAIFAIR